MLKTFDVYTYDVWGNARDGFDVNDRYKSGTVDIRCKRQVFNEGTEHQFESFEPTDRQLSIAAAFCGSVTWDGDGNIYYATARNGKPIGELHYVGENQ